MEKILFIFPMTFEAKKVFSALSKFAKPNKFGTKPKIAVGEFFAADGADMFPDIAAAADKEFCFLIAGVGCEASALRTEEVAASFKPDTVALCGFGGACSPELKIGDFVFESDSEDMAKAFESANARRGRIYSSDHIVHSAEKNSLFEKDGFLAVEMEANLFKKAVSDSGATAKFAHLRSISDTSESDIPLDELGFGMDLFSGDMTFSFAKLARSILRRPSAAAELLHLILSAGKAQKIYNLKIIDVVKTAAAQK